MAAVRRFLVHRGLVTVLVFLLVLPAPLIWMGSSTSLLDPVLYSAVIEADVEIDAECNLVSWQISSESGRQGHVAKLEALASEGIFHLISHDRAMWTHLRNKGWTLAEIEALVPRAGLAGCARHAGKFTTRAKLGSVWLNLMTFSSESWEIAMGEWRLAPASGPNHRLRQ
ncbi:MAG: hypothetical protein OXC13_16215 [Caldilineaceae bacterium]|nr:hypothetical protein [Caldilineaceae bacterium]